MSDDSKPDPKPDPDAKPDPDPDPDQDRKPDDDAFDKERALTTIRKLREAEKEGKDAKRRLAELETKLAEFEQRDLSDKEKLEKRNAELEAKVADAQKQLRQANLLAELAKPEHGIVNAAAAAKLINGVEYGDDGTPANLDDVLPAFLEQNAFLKGTPAKPNSAPDVDAGKGAGDAKPPALTAEELAAAQATGKTPEQFAAFKKPPGEAFTLADYEKAQEALKPKQ